MSVLDKLNRIELWRYANEFVSKSFSTRGFDVSRKIDGNEGLIVTNKSGKQYQIRVKSFRFSTKYVFVSKESFDINQENLYLALVLFNSENTQSVYLIPSSAWVKETDLFRDRKYEKDGHISKPEWGLNVSPKNRHLLNQYEFNKVISRLN